MRVPGALKRRVGDAAVQALIFLVLINTYQLGRHLVDSHQHAALLNALDVWHLERAAGLPDEATLQHAALAWHSWITWANAYYVRVHFPLTGLFLAWVWIWHRHDGWSRVRLVVVVSTAAALVVQIVYPLAPPRLTPATGMVDTMAIFGPDAYPDQAGTGFANQFAAMPSIHVGWALLVAWGVIWIGRSRWRWLVLIHPLFTTAVVIVTANHYWLDCLAGAAVVALAIAISTVSPLRLRSPRPTDRPRDRGTAAGPYSGGQSRTRTPGPPRT